MKQFFAFSLLALLCLSVVAWRMQPRPADPNKIPLIWASDDNPARRDQIKLFNATSPGYELRLDPNNTGLEKVIVQSIAGVGPDIFDTGEGNLSLLINAGIAWDITDELAKRGVSVERDTWKGVQTIVMRNGRTYGCPTNAAANALFINKTLFDEAKMPYPTGEWTWKEFLPIAQKLTIRDANGKAKQFGYLMDWWLWPQFVLQWGGRVFTEDGTKCTLDSSEAIAGIQFLHDLIYVHKVMPSPVEEAAMATSGGWGSGTITQFGDGKRVAMALGGRWWLCTLRNKKQFPNLKTTIAMAPYYDKPIYLGYGRASFINKLSPNREKALDFMLYETKQEYNNMVNAQADGVSPLKKYCYTKEYAFNPQFPEETEADNAIWLKTMEAGIPNPMSPFINIQAYNRIVNQQLDLVKNDQKPVAEALKVAAREVNLEIQRTLARDPVLKKQWEELVAKQQGGK
jgi:ABC-type glycerol-3-phosphate transport system substrate-binding protein